MRPEAVLRDCARTRPVATECTRHRTDVKQSEVQRQVSERSGPLERSVIELGGLSSAWRNIVPIDAAQYPPQQHEAIPALQVGFRRPNGRLVF